MIEAGFYIGLDNKRVKCMLCPHECVINDGHSGICNVRVNTIGKLYTHTYGNPVATHFDPIEKKPLYHFYPGSEILSIGTAGCNLKCFFCQNFEISQAKPDENRVNHFPPGNVIHLAGTRSNNIGIAYTYNEPVVFYEYMKEIANLSKIEGFKNIMITNGYISPEPLIEIIDYMDAFNIDLKAFNDKFYRVHTRAKLAPVLNTIKEVHKSGKHLEITNLIIPGLNDNRENFLEMIKWIRNECGERTILHLSRYFPRFKSNLPPTPVNLLDELYNIASDYLKFVYTGNYDNNRGKNTICPSCFSVVIERYGYFTRLSGIDSKGYCSSCGEKILEYI